MPTKYYVQMQARRLRKCIYPDSLDGNYPICSEFLLGDGEKSFREAVTKLRKIFSDYYLRAESEPESLKLPCTEVEKYKNTSAEARESAAALANFPAALFATSAVGNHTGGVIVTEIERLRKYYSTDLKCKDLQTQLALLTGFGFEIGGFDGKMLAKTGSISLAFPKCPSVVTVISALGKKLSVYMPAHLSIPKSDKNRIGILEQFIMLTPAVFLDASDKLPPKTLEHFIGIVGEQNRAALLKIIEETKKRGLEIKFDTTFLKNRFFDAKGKDTLSYLNYGDYRMFYPYLNETLTLRLKLNNPAAYIDKVEELPPYLQESFTKTWCGNCTDNCARRIKYNLGGEKKRACGCFFFGFIQPKAEDVDKLLELYDLELNARKKSQ